MSKFKGFPKSHEYITKLFMSCYTYLFTDIYILGHGAILSVTVTIASSSFTSDPPTFTLFGDTNGGPPTNYTWTRNNVTITDSSSFRTSIMLNRTHDTQGYLIGSYRSTLTVMGRLPGIYQYSVSNRATLDMMTSNIIIEGNYTPPCEQLWLTRQLPD